MNQPGVPPASENAPALALITGGAHRLGRAIALKLAHEGYAIGLHYHRSKEKAEQTAFEIRQIGVPVVPLPADLLDPLEIQRLFQQVAGLPYSFRVLVNSAAVMSQASLLEITPAEWDATLALNLRAPLLAAQSAAQLMPSGGVIVNISDIGARRAWTGYPAYVVSKAALEALTTLLARALAPSIRVNAIAPGLILPSAQVSPEDWEHLVRRVPLRRPGTPAEIAEAVAFFIHNEYITGQTLAIDGGFRLV